MELSARISGVPLILNGVNVKVFGLYPPFPLDKNPQISLWCLYFPWIGFIEVASGVKVVIFANMENLSSPDRFFNGFVSNQERSTKKNNSFRSKNRSILICGQV